MDEQQAPPRIRERARKVLRLKEEGRAGEAEAAAKQLQKLLDKYNLTLDDLREDEEERTLRAWRYKTKHEKHLLRQIAYTIVGPDRIPGRVYNKSSGRPLKKIGVECTEVEAADIKERFEFYRDLWAEEVEKIQSAFIQKHELFPEDGDSYEPDLDEWLDLKQRMGTLSDEEFIPEERRISNRQLPPTE